MNEQNYRERLSFPRAGAVYLLGAMLGTLLVAGCACMDTVYGSGELFAVIAKLLMIAALVLTCRVFGGLKKLTEGGYFSRYLPLVLVFPACSLVMNAGPLTASLPFRDAAYWVAGLLTEVLWEELFFRHGARLLFGRKLLFRPKTIVFTSLVYGVCHLLGSLFDPVSALWADALLSVCIGLFLTALYLRTKNILVPMTAHFLMRFTTELFLRCSDAPGSLNAGILFTAFYALVLLVIGSILLIRGARAEP